MIEIRNVLDPYLLSIHPHVWFQRAPDNALSPYLTYDFANISLFGEGHQVLTLDVDGWDNKEDSTDLEVLMSTVEESLNNHVLVGTGVVIAFYLDTKIPLTEDNKKIIRRRYVFQGKIFKRS